MKMSEAMRIIEKIDPIDADGYMVHFEEVHGNFLLGNYFPDKRTGEMLIKTENEAWELAHKFAEKTFGIYVNIYVVDKYFRPVEGYEDKKIINRDVKRYKDY